ncbi:hypothetical protein BRC83_05360 [Halobacteriales archaeon QS_1_68_17]|nr:MAG: hypothetical protein BRC83_05360 [Halobacteriales archaeon QS_1_68_17]
MTDDTEIPVIAPNLSLEQALAKVDPNRPVSPDEIRVVGYPKYLFGYDVTLERKFISDREVSLSVTVDALTGGRLRNDTYPDIEQRSLPANALLQPRVDYDTAVDKSRAVIRRYISFHFSTFVMVGNMPDMDVTREDFVFDLYWLVPTGPESAAEPAVTIINSVSGKIIEEDVAPSDVTEEALAEAESDPEAESDAR